jgi:hypothetical protein
MAKITSYENEDLVSLLGNFISLISLFVHTSWFQYICIRSILPFLIQVSFILFNCASNANSPAKICVKGSKQTHHWKLLVHLGRIWENRNREIGKVTYELGFFMVDRQVHIKGRNYSLFMVDRKANAPLLWFSTLRIITHCSSHYYREELCKVKLHRAV